jgi:hypothetical protein
MLRLSHGERTMRRLLALLWATPISVVLLTGFPTLLVGQVASGGPHGELPDSLSCSACHTTATWSPLRDDLGFDHDATDFRLDGSHDYVSCLSCHDTGRFDQLSVPLEDCGSCHLDVHSGSLQADCIQCHTTNAFTDIDILAVHPGDFALEGAHMQVTCESCHSDDLGGSYSPLPTDCESCHFDDFMASQLVDHVALGFPTDCLQCHRLFDWRDVEDFDHGLESGGFELVGMHSALECQACHRLPGGGLPTPPIDQEDCVACHRADYDGEHAGSGFPSECTACHTTNTWDGATVDHELISGGFTLIGDHDQFSCTDCHVPGTFDVIFTPVSSTDCIGCHRGDYDREHTGAGLPEDCTSCHSLTTWSGASADHGAISGGFTLVGNHGAFACTACHVPVTLDPVFMPTTPNDCVACHQPDYNSAHAGVGFPTECTACHTAVDWTSSFDHDGDFFPIYSGAHREPWSECIDCHTAAPDFAVFPCLTCHTQVKMDDKHKDRAGYSYSSPSCLSCHPAGKS